jgi:hypothetical protein
MTDLHDLYCRTLAAQMLAEEQGFAATAAAFGKVAAELAQLAGLAEADPPRAMMAQVPDSEGWRAPH